MITLDFPRHRTIAAQTGFMGIGEQELVGVPERVPEEDKINPVDFPPG